MTPRAGYLAVTWPSEAELGSAFAAILSRAMESAPDWIAGQGVPGLRIWTTRRDPPNLRRHGEDALIVGAAFDRPDAPHRIADTNDAMTLARSLSRSLWGRYIALLRDPGGGPWWSYRDPSGGLPAFTWHMADGVAVVASQIDGLPRGVGPRWPALNWDRIADFVAKPAACATRVLIDGVASVHPGQLVRLGGGATRVETIWSPSSFAADPIDDRQVAGAEFRQRVTDCTTALAGGYDRLLLEISGGLDSAILAGTLHMTGQAARVAEGLNIAFGRPESDEQSYATAVAERAGLPLTERNHAPDALDFEDLAEMAGEFRPSANAVDPKWDRDEIDRLRATGARAIISGQGGDAVFMQMSGAGVVADAWMRDGWTSLRRSVLADVARRNRRSAWSLLRDAAAERRGRARTPGELWSSLITREVRHATQDLKPRWLADAESRGVSPGKQLHIHALERFFLNEGPSRRRREADIIYPLFAQPVVEHALRVPSPVLAGANYDRAFAREVFADRLPEIVKARRAKGVVTVYFARLIANSLPALRPFLVDGVLAEARVLDRAKLEQALTVENLIWAAKPSDILWAVSAEAWVRHHQARVPDSTSAPRRR